MTRGSITAGHARALLMLMNPSDQQLLLRRMEESGISVREAEDMAASLNKGKKGVVKAGRAGTAAALNVPELREIEQKLIEKLGTKVEVHGTTAKGRIEISYFSAEDLERLLDTLA